VKNYFNVFYFPFECIQAYGTTMVETYQCDMRVLTYLLTYRVAQKRAVGRCIESH